MLLLHTVLRCRDQDEHDRQGTLARFHAERPVD